MANKTLFQSVVGALLPRTNAVNKEHARAYAYAPKHALAQYAATGSMNATFYAGADEQLKAVLELCETIEPEFIARTALFCRERAYMKDLPALLCAVLAKRNAGLLCEVFGRVIDNGKMLRNFIQIVRSGVTGRKSLGTLPKRLVQKWFDARSDEAIFKASVGNDPSLADVIKMVHPKPGTPARAALFGYLIGKSYDAAMLPELVQRFEAFKRGETADVPAVPFEMLTALELSENAWAQIALNAPWQMTRMNLNTFQRHGVFNSAKMTALVVRRLADGDAIVKARALPYQLLVAYTMADTNVPANVRDALQDAMEHALKNVPALDGHVYVCPDVSGSMSSSVTGVRKGATSKVRCIDVAALMAAAVLRKNPKAEVIPFEGKVVSVSLNARDSVMTNAKVLASIGGGATNCSAPLELLNARKAKGDLVIYVSDNQSWVDAAGPGQATRMMAQWAAFKSRNPNAKLVCIDIQPYGTTQAAERADVLNIGGFSDQVFEILAEFASGRLNKDHWIGVIEKVVL